VHWASTRSANLSRTVAIAILNGSFDVNIVAACLFTAARLGLVATRFGPDRGHRNPHSSLHSTTCARYALTSRGGYQVLVFHLIHHIQMPVGRRGSRASPSGGGIREQKKLSFRARAYQNHGPFLCCLSCAALARSLGCWQFPGQIGTTTGAFLAFNAAFTQFIGVGVGVIVSFVAGCLRCPFLALRRFFCAPDPNAMRLKADPGELTANLKSSMHVSAIAKTNRLSCHDVSVHSGARVRCGGLRVWFGQIADAQIVSASSHLNKRWRDSLDGQDLSELDLPRGSPPDRSLAANSKLSGLYPDQYHRDDHTDRCDAWEARAMAEPKKQKKKKIKTKKKKQKQKKKPKKTNEKKQPKKKKKESRTISITKTKKKKKQKQ